MTYRKLRERLFRAIVRPFVPLGQMMPKWAIALRWALFPVETTGYLCSIRFGYDIRRNGINADGYFITTEQLHMMARVYGKKL